MRIGFFTDSYFPEIDGVTYTLKTWKQELEERGHSVYVVYPGSPDYEPGEHDVPVKSLSNPFYDGYRVAVPVSADIPELDIVHCHGPGPVGIKGRLHAWRKGIPTVYTHHTPLEEYVIQAVKLESLAALIGKMYVPLENRFIAGFDEFTVSTQESNRSPDHTKLPVGVDTEFFHPSDSSLLEGFERPVAGYSGRISPEKNVEELLELAERFEGTVVIVGEGPEKPGLVEKSPENVVFMDWLEREELPGFYTGIDVFITASKGDTLGLSTLEANSCGTPVVAPDTHPFNETIGSQQGLRFETGNIEDFREKVQKALEQGFKPREAVRKYSLEHTLDRLEEIYRRIDNGD